MPSSTWWSASVSLALVLGLLVFSPSTSAQGGKDKAKFQVVEAVLEAKSRLRATSVPAVLTFEGHVKVNAAGTVRYQFLHGKESSTAATLTFAKAGTKPVTYTLKVAKASEDEGVILEILAPNALKSKKAVFAPATGKMPTFLALQKGLGESGTKVELAKIERKGPAVLGKPTRARPSCISPWQVTRRS